MRLIWWVLVLFIIYNAIVASLHYEDVFFQGTEDGYVNISPQLSKD